MTYGYTVLNVDLTIDKNVELPEGCGFTVDIDGDVILDGPARNTSLVEDMKTLLRHGAQGTIEVQDDSHTTFFTFYLIDNQILKQRGRVVYDGDINEIGEVNELEYMVSKGDKRNNIKEKLKDRMNYKIMRYLL